MATISVKFRQSTVKGKMGTVYYQVIHHRRMARINTDIRITQQEWDVIKKKTDDRNGMLLIVSKRIDADISTAYRITRALTDSGKDYTAQNIVECFKGQNRETLVSSNPPPYGVVSGGLVSFMLDRISELKQEKQYSTAANYRHTLDSFSSFAESENIGNVTLSLITETLMERYEAWLQSRGLKRNTTSFYMRILRAVYNLAVKQGLVSQAYPFRKVYTGIDLTHKRAAGEEAIKALNNLDLTDKPKLQLAKDLFLFSFATCGMPFVDMAYLKRSDIKDGYIRYERRKTRQPLQVKVVPLVEDIIKRYRQDGSPYIFPVIKSTDRLSAYREYRTALTAYNRHLQEISEMLPEKVSLTSYVSRHSWATIARDHGGTAALIGKALGHTSERTTQIYLGSINDTAIDRMNGEILGCLQKR